MRITGSRRVIKLGFSGDLQALAHELQEPPPTPATPQVEPYSTGFNWDWLTKSYVIRFFELSPVLREMAGDVRALLGSQAAQEGRSEDLQVQQDLAAIKHLFEPSKADIAEELTGQRTYGGATYRRVKAAFDAFYTTTTGQKSVSERGSSDRAA